MEFDVVIVGAGPPGCGGDRFAQLAPDRARGDRLRREKAPVGAHLSGA
jgi:hypothetical protein